MLGVKSRAPPLAGGADASAWAASGVARTRNGGSLAAGLLTADGLHVLAAAALNVVVVCVANSILLAARGRKALLLFLVEVWCLGRCVRQMCMFVDKEVDGMVGGCVNRRYGHTRRPHHLICNNAEPPADQAAFTEN